MRSPTITVLLLLLTIATCGLATWHFSEGYLNDLFGGAAKEGDRLYTFNPLEVHRIGLRGNGATASCVFEDGSWKIESTWKEIESPWKDRMDPRFADAILRFTLGAQVVDAIPKGKLESAKSMDSDLAGDGITEIRIENKAGAPLAKYRLGVSTPFISYNEKDKSETPTVFVRPMDKNRKGYTYACTGDINVLFKDGFRSLRDHHPFYFDRKNLDSIRIVNSEGAMLLKHLGPDPDEKHRTAWRITQPQELWTDPQAMETLLMDLTRLRAVKILNHSEVTLTPFEAGKGETIAIKHFGESTETILQVYPADPADAETVHATISNRPDTVFKLLRKPPAAELGAPRNPADDIVVIDNLPDTVNELRNQALTNINGASLAGIGIRSATGTPIALVREDIKSDFKVQIGDSLQRPNTEALARLISFIAKTKVAGFKDDAATDLTPYGLDRPSLELQFVSFKGDGDFSLRFGQGHDGTWYENRVDGKGVPSPTVAKMDDSFVNEIATHTWQWRDTSLWSIPKVYVSGIIRTIGTKSLSLKYQFPSWEAIDDGKDRSAAIDKARAEHFLDALVNLRAATWLSPETAELAGAEPFLSFEIVERNPEDADQPVKIHKLTVLASKGEGTRLYVGRINGDESPFLLRENDVRNLVVNLFVDE